MSSGLAVETLGPVRVHRITATDKDAAWALMQSFMGEDKWLQFEPLPDGEYAIFIKAGEPTPEAEICMCGAPWPCDCAAAPKPEPLPIGAEVVVTKGEWLGRRGEIRSEYSGRSRFEDCVYVWLERRGRERTAKVKLIPRAFLSAIAAKEEEAHATTIAG